MRSDINWALTELANTNRRLTRGLLDHFSGLSADECEMFMCAFQKLPEERRREAIALMTTYAEERFDIDFVDIFRCCLSDLDPFVRRHAVEGLWEDERPGLLKQLLSMLRSDPDDEVREATAISLGRFVFLGECEKIDRAKSEAVRQALETVIANQAEPTNVVRRAVEAIAFINDESIRRIIHWAYAHHEEQMRISAVFAMGRSADPYWADIVLSELHSENPAMRFEAARACGEIVLAEAVPTLIRMIDERDAEIRDMAIWALGQIGGKRARRALEKCMDSEDKTLVEAAQEALDELTFLERPLDLFVFDPDQAELREIDLDEEEEKDPWLTRDDV